MTTGASSTAVLVALTLGCSADSTRARVDAMGEIPDAAVSTRLFATGYEPDEAAGEPADAHDLIRFQNTVPGGPSPVVAGIFYETPGTVADRYARIIEDPTQPGNHVLQIWLANAVIDAGYMGHTKGRVQSDFSPGAQNGRSSVCAKQRLYLHPNLAVLASYPNPGDWWLALIVHEMWLGAAWQGHPNAARISIGIAPAWPDTGLRFYADAQKMRVNQAPTPADIMWTAAGNYVLPVGEWITVETRYRMGDADTGRFVMIVQADSDATPTTVIDVTDYTYNSEADLTGGTGPVPLTNWNPQKVYSSDNALDWIRDQAGPAQIYFDDFEITSPCAF